MTRQRESARLGAVVLLFSLTTACASGLPEEPEGEDATRIAVGESREIELRFVRFDVTNFEQTLTREDVLDLPRDVQERLWLLDLDLTNGPNSPRLLDNSIAAVKELDPSSLSVAARNMHRLLTMTPDTADLEGTALEDLIALAPLLGIAAERVLADMLGIDAEDTFLSTEVVSESILAQVIATHPNAQQRLGPRTEENPDGIYPVTPGTLPINLRDVATNFASLSERYGEVFIDGGYHPGFIVGETVARVLTDSFRLTVRANANALPYKGVDLTSVTRASVSSVRSQIEELFDFDDPNWLVIEGLVPGAPVIESLSFRVVEHDAFVYGGRSPFPRGIGSSPVWQLPPWCLERVVAGAAQMAFADHDAELSYYRPTSEDPIFAAVIEDGWQEIEVDGDVGQPPEPAYLWDLLLEVAQVRLHDDGLAEGEADVEFTLTDVPAGTDTAIIERTIEENLAADPYSLLDVATETVANTRGDADFYYYRASGENPTQLAGDWLFFINEDDIPVDDNGEPTRGFTYTNPGFYADEQLSEAISSPQELDGDTAHQKVRVEVGDRLFVADDEGAVYQIDIQDKPSLARLVIAVTRLR